MRALAPLRLGNLRASRDLDTICAWSNLLIRGVYRDYVGSLLKGFWALDREFWPWLVWGLVGSSASILKLCGCKADSKGAGSCPEDFGGSV